VTGALKYPSRSNVAASRIQLDNGNPGAHQMLGSCRRRILRPRRYDRVVRRGLSLG